MTISGEQAVDLPWSTIAGALTMAALFLTGIVIGVIFIYRHATASGLRWKERSRFLYHVPISEFTVKVLVGAILSGLLVVVAAAHLFKDMLYSDWGFVLQSIMFHWLIIAFIAVWLWRSKWSWKALFGLSGKSFAPSALMGICAYLIALPVVLASGFFYQILLVNIGYEPSPQPIMEFMTGDMGMIPRFYAIAVAVLIAPVAEEFLFRGLFLPVLTRRIGTVAAIALTSVLFAAMHLFIPALVPLFVVSVACSLSYIYTGSLFAPIALHSIFNSVNLALFTLLRDTMM